MFTKRQLFVLVLYLLVAVPATGTAQESLSLAEAEMIAVRDDPRRDALQARGRAMRERAVAAGEWPDPQLRFGVTGVPVQGFPISREPMAQAVVGLRQSIPSAPTLTARQNGFRAMADEFDAEQAARALEVVRTIRELWFEIHYWAETEHSIQEVRGTFASLVDVARSQYAVGRSSQHDIIRAELELDRLDEQVIHARQRVGELRAALAGWVGPRALGSLLDPQLRPAEMPPADVLIGRIDSHPIISALDARVAAAEAEVAVAHARFRPSWAVDLSYGMRRGTNPDGSSRSDVATLVVSFDLPIFTADRQDRDLGAARNGRSAAHADRAQVVRQLTVELERALAIWNRTSERLRLYDDVLIPQTSRQAEAALNAYGAGFGDFAEVMRSHIDALNIRLDRLRIETDRNLAWVVIDSIGGLDDA